MKSEERRDEKEHCPPVNWVFGVLSGTWETSKKLRELMEFGLFPKPPSECHFQAGVENSLDT